MAKNEDTTVGPREDGGPPRAGAPRQDRRPARRSEAAEGHTPDGKDDPRDARPAPFREGRLAIRIAHTVDTLFARIYQNVTVQSPCRLPRAGRAILVSNHTSGLDPFLIQACYPRIITWMMAREYYEIKALKWFFKIIAAIPVERSGRDMAATRAAMRALADGRVLGIFPEGKIETTRELLPFQVGVAMLAIKSRAPVYPIFLDGTQRGLEMATAFLRRNRASITFGPEVEFDRSSTSRETLEAATQKIQAAVETLRRAAPRRPWC